MILVDERIGSREQLSILRQFGVDAELAGQLSADYQFEGHGPFGPVLIGVERKTITDLLQSMRGDKRLAGLQIPGMLQTYDVCYLIVEGIWRRQRDTGLVELRNGAWHAARGRFYYAEADRFLCSLEELAGVRVWRTADEEETCAALADRYLWWSKPWDGHATHQTLYAPEPKQLKRGSKAKVWKHDPTLLERWICALPGIDSRASTIATNFDSALDMATADVARWMRIKNIGRKTAEGIVKEIQRSA